MSTLRYCSAQSSQGVCSALTGVSVSDVRGRLTIAGVMVAFGVAVLVGGLVTLFVIGGTAVKEGAAVAVVGDAGVLVCGVTV